MSKVTEANIAVVGAGPSGWATALSLAQSGFDTCLLAAPHRPTKDKPDTRTAALFTNSIAFLRNLGCWHDLEAQCAPITTMRLIDSTGHLFKAPQLSFHAQELGLDAFGYNVPQGALLESLRRRGQSAQELSIVETSGVTHVEPTAESVALRTAENYSLVTKLVAAADGRNSLCRQAVGIDVDTRPYDQMALACTFSHSRPHENASNEFHFATGPCTTVPLPGSQSSLVWVERPHTAKKLTEMPQQRFAHLLENTIHGLLGTISDVSARVVFPLSRMTANNLARNRVVLIGEAGHVVPPIGAQGLNMSLRDAAELVDILAEVCGDPSTQDNDPGSTPALERYHKARIGDVKRVSKSVDLLNQTLISHALPLQLVRGAGLHALNLKSPLRRFVMRQGMSQMPGKTPRMMQATSAT